MSRTAASIGPGAYACDDFIMVGTDDGDALRSYLYLFDPLTGKVLDFKSGFDSDIPQYDLL